MRQGCRVPSRSSAAVVAAPALVVEVGTAGVGNPWRKVPPQRAAAAGAGGRGEGGEEGRVEGWKEAEKIQACQSYVWRFSKKQMGAGGGGSGTAHGGVGQHMGGVSTS